MNHSLAIKINNTSPHPLPKYATEGSSGLDVQAFIQQPLQLLPMQRTLIPTGIFMEIPLGYEAQIRPRSGLALKQGITCLNTPGTIDADYRGEIKVILINLSNETQMIHNGDRIAQIVFMQIEKIQWNVTETLTNTVRGNGGFGHTGKN